MARFFIDRPIFAWVIAIVIMLAGGLSMISLPVSMYPEVAPPGIQVHAQYPGASAQVVEDSVTQVIEQNMKGLDGLIYFLSSSSSNGSSTTVLTFANGTDPDIAQVQVQNKLQLAMPSLPQEVQQQGVNVSQSNGNVLQIVAFVSEDGKMAQADISDYVGANVADPISRVEGVGDVRVFGTRYAMRIWLDPNKLDTYSISVDEIADAVRAQNAQVTVGQLGGTPSIEGQQLNATISGQSRLQTAEEFREVVVRSNEDGSLLTLDDVARVELGQESYTFLAHHNGQPASGLSISLAADANALETAERVRQRLDELERYFPEGLKVVVPFDTTPFVKVSVDNVVHTLVEAIVLVFAVMFLFLQNFRATLIPTIAVPVVLLGTFGVLAALGYSINMLTMFAMILAIGLLVDDAIVVVENVERLMADEGLSPLEATRKSMGQITGALVGIGVVLSAVFVPMAFMSGSTGVIYRQFSVTIVSAMTLSVLVAIVLTPALCATMLKPSDAVHDEGKGFFGWFNRKLATGTAVYQRGVGGILARKGRFLAIFLIMCGIMAWLFMRLPGAFLPEEDQGVLSSMIQAPVGATQQRTMGSIRALENHFLENEKEAVASVFTVQGFSFAGEGQNAGTAYINLKHWDERESEELSAKAVTGRAMGALSQVKDANIVVFLPPAMPNLGTAAGFELFLKDNVGLGHDALMEARDQVLKMAGENPLLQNVRHTGLEDTPQLRVEIDNKKARALGLSLAQVNSTLSAAWGSRYIDDFIDRGRIKRVYLQADAPFRMTPEDFNLWSVKNRHGEMVPFSSFAHVSWDYGPPRLERYNGVPALKINGEAAPGVSSGEAMAEMERLVEQLPGGFGMEWTNMSYQEKEAGSQTTLLYTLSLMVVFLCLAALYESWTIPAAVILVAPLGILGAVLANTLRGMERDVYFQVAMLTTVGLSSKNAILIVEFAKQYLDEGMELIQATMQAVRDRLRPILMTSLAFGLGVLPLAISSGAGSGAQQAIGTGVLGGMLAGTLLGIFFAPLFFVVVQKLFGGKRKLSDQGEQPDSEKADPAMG